jgi:hypothetical protein
MKNMIILVFCLLFEVVTAMIPENPRVTVLTRCPRHGLLTVHMEIANRVNGQEELLDKDIRALKINISGETTDLHYVAAGAEIILRKTVIPHEFPRDSRLCYMIPIVLNATDNMRIMKALLTGVDGEEFLLEGGETARLHMNPGDGE